MKILETKIDFGAWEGPKAHFKLQMGIYTLGHFKKHTTQNIKTRHTVPGFTFQNKADDTFLLFLGHREGFAMLFAI